MNAKNILNDESLSLEEKFEAISDEAGKSPSAAIKVYKRYFDENVSSYRTPSRMAVRAAIAIVEGMAKKLAALENGKKKTRKGDRLKTGGRVARRLGSHR